MSNPAVNRWGSNSIWYHFWYSDKNYAKQVNQDRIFSQLLETYLAFGVETHHSHFNNLYWYRRVKKKYPASAYYRSFVIRNELLGSETRHRVRITIKDVYRMRTWILRYNKWLVINMYWFQPYKKRAVVGRILSKVSRNYVSIENRMRTTVYRRLISLNSLTDTSRISTLKKNNTYLF